MDEKAIILIVDDRPEKVLALRAILEDLNEEIVPAYTGREALREVLRQEFAVILLDINMPGMDGFETASLIRQRKSSRHTPIIFITAYGDEMHAATGYSLGAVDYILAPVVPEVLKTKVSVFVDLYKKTAQVKRQADSLQRRAMQMQKLAAASMSINAALSMEKMLATITEAARDVIGCRQAITLSFGEQGAGLTQSSTVATCAFSPRHGRRQARKLDLGPAAVALLEQSRTAVRLAEHELPAHPASAVLSHLQIPALRGGLLAGPLIGRDGAGLGVIYLTDPAEHAFTAEDEAVLLQLAQMASIAIENTVYAQEREANRLKDEFLATLSHELRTPLHSMLGWTQLLRMEDLGDEAAHGLEVIERNVRAQAKLVDDLLDVSRITSGKMRLNPRPTPIASIIDAGVEAVRPAAQAKHIDLDWPGADQSLIIFADADRLQQVFWNLLSNAVKFTPAGGRVTLRLEQDDRAVRLLVRDTGQGIDPQFLPYVFDRFRQGDSTSTRHHSGLGVGLTIVRHIVELHGGSASAQSAGAGRGSTFIVELPRVAADAGVAGSGPIERLPKQPCGFGAEPVLNADVLVVDDDADACELVAQILRRHHARVTTAASVEEALDLLPRLRPNLLISDIAMPECDGYDFIRAVRRLSPEEGRNVPAIALTAYARDEDRRRALAAGFHGHLPKPIDANELLAEVLRVSTGVATNGAADDRQVEVA